MARLSNRNKVGFVPRAPDDPARPISVSSILEGRVRTYYGPGQDLRVSNGIPYAPPNRWIAPGRLLTMPKVVLLTSDLRIHPAVKRRRLPTEIWKPGSIRNGSFLIKPEIPPPHLTIKNFARTAYYNSPVLYPGTEASYHIPVYSLIPQVYTGAIEGVLLGSQVVSACVLDSAPVEAIHTKWQSGDPDEIVYDDSIYDDDASLKHVREIFEGTARALEKEFAGLGFAHVVNEFTDAEAEIEARRQLQLIRERGGSDAFPPDREIIDRILDELNQRPVVDLYTPMIAPPTDQGFLGVDFLHVHVGDPGFHPSDSYTRGEDHVIFDDETVIKASAKRVKESAPFFRRFQVHLWPDRKKRLEWPGYPDVAPPTNYDYYEQINDYGPIYDPLSDHTFENDIPPSQIVPVDGPAGFGVPSPPGGQLVNPGPDDPSPMELSHGQSVCHNVRKTLTVPSPAQSERFYRDRAGTFDEDRPEEVNRYYDLRYGLAGRIAAAAPKYVKVMGDASELSVQKLVKVILDHLNVPVQ